jgi:hypothetical protein
LNGTLMVHSGGRTRTRQELALLPTPPGTDTWKPVPHYELVDSLIEGLTAHNIAITREAYATSGRDDASLSGVLDCIASCHSSPSILASAAPFLMTSMACSQSRLSL